MWHRWRSVIVATFGSSGGLGLGVFLAWAWCGPSTLPTAHGSRLTAHGSGLKG